MAKTKKTRARKAKRTGAAKAGRKKTVRRAGSASASGAAKRLAELQAENRRLRDEIASLRSQLADRADQGDQAPGEQTPLGL